MKWTSTRSISQTKDGGFFQRTSRTAITITKDGSVWIKSGPTAILAYSRNTLCRRNRTSGTESRVANCESSALRQDITDGSAPDSLGFVTAEEDIAVTTVTSSRIQNVRKMAWRARWNKPWKWRLSLVWGIKDRTEDCSIHSVCSRVYQSSSSIFWKRGYFKSCGVIHSSKLSVIKTWKLWSCYITFQ